MDFTTLDPPASTALLDAGVEWQQAPCPLCHSSQWAVRLEAEQMATSGPGPSPAVVQCRRCGLCFTNPRPGPGSIARFYPAEYKPHQPGSRAAECGRRTRWWSRLTDRLRRRPAQRRELPKFGQCRLLDFGCGNGSYLARMDAQGWRVLGLDVSPAAVEQVRSAHGLPALVGTLPHPQLAPASFEVITMWQSLEHVHRPLEVLQHAGRLLVPGGRLIVAVPNIDGAPFRWFGSSWYGLDLPCHLTHFSPATLTGMVQRAGFRVAELRMAWHSSWLQSSARLATRQGRGAVWLGWLKLRPICRLVGWYCLLRGQSDCIILTATKANPLR